MQDPSYARDEANAAVPVSGNSSSGEENAAYTSPCFVAEVDKITAVSSGCGFETPKKFRMLLCEWWK